MIELLDTVIDLARRTGCVYVATASAEGMPHIAVAGQMGRHARDRVFVKEWFCPGTIANLKENKAVALAVWDVQGDAGYQLLGRLERIEDLAVMDGYTPQVENDRILPQVEKQLIIRIEKVLDFTPAPHSDLSADAAL